MRSPAKYSSSCVAVSLRIGGTSSTSRRPCRRSWGSQTPISTSPSHSRTRRPIGVSSGMVAVVRGGGAGGGGAHAARPFAGGVGMACGRGGQRPQVDHGVAAPRAPAFGQRPRGGPGRRAGPRACAARRMPRSVGMNASGSRSARMATYSAVHGPMPGQRHQRRGAARRGRRPGRSRRRRARPPRPAPTRARRRPAGMAKAPGSRAASSASAAGVGKRWVIAPSAPGSGSPAACTSRPATVRAPGTETCWPITARTASSKPSAAPGTRRPGSRSTSGPDERVAAQGLPDGDGVGVEVEQLAAARHGGGAGRAGPRGRARLPRRRTVRSSAPSSAVGGAQRHDAVAVGEAQAAAVGRSRRALDPGEGAGAEEGEHRRRVEGRRQGSRSRMAWAAGARAGAGPLAGGGPRRACAAGRSACRRRSGAPCRCTGARWRSRRRRRRGRPGGRSSRAGRAPSGCAGPGRVASGPVPTSAVTSRFSWRVL